MSSYLSYNANGGVYRSITSKFSGKNLETNDKAEILYGVFPDSGSYDKNYRLLSQITLGNYMDG